jgi:hypothetical protein
VVGTIGWKEREDVSEGFSIMERENAGDVLDEKYFGLFLLDHTGKDKDETPPIVFQTFLFSRIRERLTWYVGTYEIDVGTRCDI